MPLISSARARHDEMAADCAMRLRLDRSWGVGERERGGGN